MKCTFVTALGMALALPLALQAGPAQAKKKADWIQAISVKKDGINTTSIKVPAKDGQYQAVLDGNYRFNLLGHVKAKKNRWIARVVWQSKENPFFAKGASKPSWEKRALIRQGLRETKIDTAQSIPLSRLTWVESPSQACASLKAQKLGQGMRAQDVLGREWNATAKAAIHMKAYVTRKKAKKLTDTNYDTETAMLSYPVNVSCLAEVKTPKPRDTASTKKAKRQPPARAPRVPIK